MARRGFFAGPQHAARVAARENERARRATVREHKAAVRQANDAIWGSLLLAGDRFYVGNEAGLMTVLRAGRRKELLAQIEMEAPLYSRPDVIGDALYLATATRLYLIATQP